MLKEVIEDSISGHIDNLLANGTTGLSQEDLVAVKQALAELTEDLGNIADIGVSEEEIALINSELYPLDC